VQKDAASSQPAPLTDEMNKLEAKITTIVKQVAAEKGSA
jgi:hypothetical protein